MTPEATFRRIALSFPDAVESAHLGSTDFRRNGRIVATLAFRARGLGTLKLTPVQQHDFLADLPDYSEPAPGGWGRMGMTLIRLDAPEDILRGALHIAYNNLQTRSKVPSPRSRKPSTHKPIRLQ